MAYPNWLPTSRAGVSGMGNSWVTITQNKKTAWNIPDDTVNALAAKVQAFDAINNTPPAARTPAVVAQIKTAEKELVAVMRDVKKRHFFQPPLTDADLVTLGLKPRDTNPTPIARPAARPSADVKLISAGAFDLVISPERDISHEKKSYHGCKIVYDLFEQGAAPPTSEKQLTEMRFVRRKKESFVFQPQDSGKKAYFAMRYENSKGEAGPWCPIFSVLIP